MTTQYELLYIISENHSDDDIGNVENVVKAILEKYGATLDNTTRLGKFRFAYPIKNTRYGQYVLVRFTSEGSAIKEIEEALRISSEVLRHLIVRADEAGGDKFEFLQFVEVNLDNKESGERRRDDRRPAAGAAAKPADEAKADVAKVEDAKADEAKTEVAAPAAAEETVPGLSAEELDKKIDAALDAKA